MAKTFIQSSRLWRWTALALMAGVGIEWLLLPKPANAEAYHARIRAAAGMIPTRIGSWVGQEIPVPDSAVKMLSPNVILSRRYVNVTTGAEASLLLVQCGDARDIVVHYPPVCLCNAGWTLTDATPRDWALAALPLHGTEYQFTMHSLDRMAAITVDNFMLLPDKPVARNMDAVNDAASDVRRRYFGAAQVQVITPAAMPGGERTAVFAELTKALEPTIAAIREGVAR